MKGKQRRISNENSTFVKFFGNYPKIKMLDYLLENRKEDIHSTNIYNNIKISKPTLIELREEMVRDNILTQTRTIGRAIMFKLNNEDYFVKRLIEFHNALKKK